MTIPLQSRIMLGIASTLAVCSLGAHASGQLVYNKSCGEGCTGIACRPRIQSYGYHRENWRRWPERELMFPLDGAVPGTTAAPLNDLPSPRDEGSSGITSRSGEIGPEAGSEQLPGPTDEFSPQPPGDGLPDLDLELPDTDARPDAPDLTEPDFSEPGFGDPGPGASDELELDLPFEESPLDETPLDLDGGSPEGSLEGDLLPEGDDDSFLDLGSGRRRGGRQMASRAAYVYLPSNRPIIRRDDALVTAGGRTTSTRSNPLRVRPAAYRKPDKTRQVGTAARTTQKRSGTNPLRGY